LAVEVTGTGSGMWFFAAAQEVTWLSVLDWLAVLAVRASTAHWASGVTPDRIASAAPPSHTAPALTSAASVRMQARAINAANSAHPSCAPAAPDTPAPFGMKNPPLP
jgi:hypothetical protein